MSTPYPYGKQWRMEDKVARFGKTFQSERLIYQPIEDSEEVTAFLKELYNNPIVKGLSEFGPIKPTRKKEIKHRIKNFEEKCPLAMLVCLPPAETAASSSSESTKIGMVILSPKWEKAVSMGIVMAPEYQNKGYGKEAINWAMDWTFLHGGYHRLGIGTVEFNERARGLYLALGFVQEGRVRGAAWVDGQWHDIVEYSLLDFEWRRLRGIK